jgi:hypothetical protein
MTFDQLLSQYDKELNAAFLASIDEIKSKIRIKEIIEALDRGDTRAALDVLFLEREAYAEFERVLEQAFEDGGDHIIQELGELRDQEANRFVFRFNARNLAAERIIREHSSNLITRIVDDQKTAVRTALEQGLQEGNNPRTVALDIVGRIDRRTGRRTGGILGLSATQEKAVANARLELQNGDFTAFMGRTKRDKRFDAMLKKAKQEDTALSKQQIDKLLARYSDRLLKLRGDTIGRTEALTSLHKGQYEAVQQLIQTGKVRANQVSLMWDASLDARTRIDHMIADKQLVKFGEDFVVGGRLMKYPGDPAGGADQVVNCRCALRIRVNYNGNV